MPKLPAAGSSPASLHRQGGQGVLQCFPLALAPSGGRDCAHCPYGSGPSLWAGPCCLTTHPTSPCLFCLPCSLLLATPLHSTAVLDVELCVSLLCSAGSSCLSPPLCLKDSCLHQEEPGVSGTHTLTSPQIMDSAGHNLLWREGTHPRGREPPPTPTPFEDGPSGLMATHWLPFQLWSSD